MYTVPAQRLRARLGGRLSMLTLILAILALPAAAELGGTVDTVQADQAHMKGTLRVTPAAGYTLHEIQAGTGTTVREFVSPSGKVFGVAWQGPFVPDMRQLLGSYFEQYSQRLQGKRARGPIIIHEPNLVVEAGGHMRSFQGRAYVPQLAPAGMDLKAIK